MTLTLRLKGQAALIRHRTVATQRAAGSNQMSATGVPKPVCLVEISRAKPGVAIHQSGALERLHCA